MQFNELKGKHVSIVGLGPSSATYVDHTKRLGGASNYCDEVWAINGMGDVLKCDRIFHMDDVRVQELRAEAKPASNIAFMLRWLRKHPGPIYTSHVEPGYKGLVAYPLSKVVKQFSEAYFNSTVPYALALAIYAGVDRISLFGCDYSYEQSHKAERGRACLEFWIAIAKTRGIQISLPQDTSLMDAIEGPDALFYGYDGQKIRLQDDFELTFEPRDLPTAAEIEHRYDHTRPTSAHARIKKEAPNES